MLIEVNDTIGRGLIASGIAKEVSPAPAPVANTAPPPVEDTLFAAIGRPTFNPLDATVVTTPSGKTRTWPAPHPSGENAWGYATRVSQMLNPETGWPFFDPSQLGRYVLGTPGGAEGQAEVRAGQFAYTADRMMYPEDWGPALYANASQAPFHWRSEQQAPSLEQWVLLGNDEDRALYLDRNTQVARYLINSGKLSPAESSRLANLAIQLRASGRV